MRTTIFINDQKDIFSVGDRCWVRFSHQWGTWRRGKVDEINLLGCYVAIKGGRTRVEPSQIRRKKP